MKSIPESDVIFGPYDEKDLFHIEKSELYKSLGEGLKTVEFILRASTTERGIVFVEAKSNGSKALKKCLTVTNGVSRMWLKWKRRLRTF